MLRVDGVIKAADVRGREFTGEIGKRGAELRKLRERGLADNRNRIVWRKIVAVVGPSPQTQRKHKGGPGNFSDAIHLIIDEGAGGEGEGPHLLGPRAKQDVNNCSTPAGRG